MKSFAFTVTLKPKFRMVKGVSMLAPWQYDMSYEHICDLLHSVNVTIYTVVAEITKAGDIHYHAVLNSEDDYKGLQYNLACVIKDSKIFGFFVLKEIKDMEGWITYMTKDLESTHKLLNRPAVVRDDLSIIKVQEKFGNMPL